MEVAMDFGILGLHWIVADRRCPPVCFGKGFMRGERGTESPLRAFWGLEDMIMKDNKPRLVGLNHVALEVGDVEAALKFYGHVFSFELRGSHKGEDGRLEMAFLDMGDQFLALSKGRSQAPDDKRHFGLVVDDRTRVKALVLEAGGKSLDGEFVDFLDPWGNRIEVVEYRALQFTKSAEILRWMELSLEKSPAALKELRDKTTGS